MAFLERYAKKITAPGPGVNEPPPKRGFKRLLFVLSTYFWKTVVLNLVFLLCSLGLVTIPASLCALFKTAYMLYSTGICDVWQDFTAEFGSVFKKSLAVGAVSLLMTGLPVLAIVLYLRMASSVGTAGMILSAIILAYMYIVMTYAYLQTAVIDIPVKAIIKNAFILSFGRIKNSLVLLFAPGLMLFLMLFFIPFTLPVIILIGISLYALCVCAVLDEPLSLCISSGGEGQ